MMTRSPKGSSRFSYGFPIVGIVVLVVAAILAGGISVAVIPGIVVAAVIWAIIWIGGGKIGDAFADWLERR
jgi:hypothetical protein